MADSVMPVAAGSIVLVVFLVLVAIGLRVLFTVLAYRVGKRKGQEVAGLLLGLFLSWIGLIIVYAMPDAPGSSHDYPRPTGEVRRQCRHCSREVPANARFCPNCGHET